MSGINIDLRFRVPSMSSKNNSIKSPNSGLGLWGTGMNMGELGQLGIEGLGAGVGLFNAFNSNKLAKRALGLQLDAFRQNSANQTKSYNTELANRARSRFHMEGGTQAQADAYVQENKLR